MDAITASTATLWLLVAVALLFDFLNGLHDAANSIATIVSTRVLKPRYAVMWAAFFNFVAFLVFGLHVAKTVGSGIIDVQVVTDRVIFAALTGAIVWNVVTWLAGIPSSSSHALVGGLIGAGLAKAGPKVIVVDGVLKTTGAIIGVGAARRTTAVRWGVARSIVVAWIVTMPMAALVAAGAYAVSGGFLQ